MANNIPEFKIQTVVFKIIACLFIIAGVIASYWINFSIGLTGTLAIYYGRPFIAGLFISILFNNLFSKHVIAFAILIFVACLITYCGAFSVSEMRLEYDVYKFDLNGDKIFSPEEETPEWQKLWDRYIGDGGRNVFAFVLLPLYSAITTILILILFSITIFLRQKVFRR